MVLLSIPNVSEGRDLDRLARMGEALVERGVRILDTHRDAAHNRTVFTTTGDPRALVAGMAALAVVATEIDMTTHSGVHPRLGGLDVCPFVPHGASLDAAIRSARRAGRAVAEAARVPVYLYAEAATRPQTRSLPDIRKGGLAGLAERARAGLAPDFGPAEIDLRKGVVCVGARGPLVAFNVWLRGGAVDARRIAARVRSTGGGPDGVRALGLELFPGVSQVSMNLVDPERTGIDAAYEAVDRAAAEAGIEITGTEIVGLVPARLLPDPNAAAARLLLKPGRSLEAVL